MNKSFIEQMNRDEMFLIQSPEGKKKLPFKISNTADIIKPFTSDNNRKEESLAMFYSSVYIRPNDNFMLIDIGYSPTEKIEIKNLKRKNVYFSLTSINYTSHVEFFSYTTVFDAKCYFANHFYTIPQNIVIEHQGKLLKDDSYLFDFDNNEDDPFQISLKKGYQLYFIFFDQFRYACMKDDSTLKDLKYSLSSKSHLNFGVFYGERIKKYFNTTDQNEIDQQPTLLNDLSKEISIFDFNFNFSPDSDINLISIDVIIETNQSSVSQKFKIEGIDSNSTIYLITCILEREYQIDRSLFIPYDDKNNQLDMNTKIKSNMKLKFKITKTLFIKIKSEIKEFSYMTTIGDIKRMYNFTKNQFGVIINKRFAVERDGKEYLSHYLTNSENGNEATEIILKYPIKPCHIRSFTNSKTNKTKKFIVPDFFDLEKAVNIYLLRNYNSIIFTKKVKNEQTQNIDYVFQVKDSRQIDIIFIDEDGKSHNMTVDVKGEKPRIIDLFYAVDQVINDRLIKKSFVYEASLAICQNPTKLHFMQLLSKTTCDKDNKITVHGYLYQKKKEDGSKTLKVRNCMNGEILSFKYDNLSAKEIINKVLKKIKCQGENFELYMQYNKLNPDDHPLICKQQQDFFIFSEIKEEKNIVISNGAVLKVPITIKKEYFSDIPKIIMGMFGLTDSSNPSFSFNAYGNEYKLPRNFDAGCLPDDCEVSINYIYSDRSKCITFDIRNTNKATKVNLTDIDYEIQHLKSEIQEKLHIYDMTTNSMRFTFYDPKLNINLTETKKFTDYKIPENAIIRIMPQYDSFIVSVKTPEKVFRQYYVSPNDTIDDVIKLIKYETGYDKELKLENEKGRKITGEQKMTPDMKISLNTAKIEIESNGSLSTKKHKINEILTIKEANEYLKTKLKDSNISIFTYNEVDNYYEEADSTKRLYEFDTKLFVHKLFTLEEICFNDTKIKLNIKNYRISECNTVEYLKNNYISNKLSTPPEKIIFYSKSGKIDESHSICDVFKNKDDPIKFKFTFDNSITSHSQKKLNQPKPEKIPQSTPPKARRLSKFKPKLTPLNNESDQSIRTSKTADSLPTVKSQKTVQNEQAVKIDENEEDSNDQNNSESDGEPDYLTKCQKNHTIIHKNKIDEKSSDDEENNNEEESDDEEQKSKKGQKNKKENSSSKSDKKVDEEENEEKSDDDSDDDDKESSSSEGEKEESADEEEVTYKIQIGRDSVKTISLKKSATINDLKIKIAKEEDDIDPNCVIILFAGKNLKKNIVIEKLKLKQNDILQVYIRNIEEILLRTAKALQVYGERDIEEYYSDDYDDDDE